MSISPAPPSHGTVLSQDKCVPRSPIARLLFTAVGYRIIFITFLTIMTKNRTRSTLGDFGVLRLVRSGGNRSVRQGATLCPPSESRASWGVGLTVPSPLSLFTQSQTPVQGWHHPHSDTFVMSPIVGSLLSLMISLFFLFSVCGLCYG